MPPAPQSHSLHTSIGRTSRPRRSRIGAVAAIAIVAAIALSGCSAGFGIGAASVDIETARLHPTGPDGAWFSDDYADGPVSSFATSDILCTIAPDAAIALGAGIDSNPDVAIVSVRTGNGGGHVQARRLSDATVLWERQQMSCSPGPMLDGTILLTSTIDADSGALQFVDPRTGKAAIASPTEGWAGYSRPLGMAGELRVIEARGTLFGMRPDGSVAWTYLNDFANEIIPLGDGNFALEGPNEQVAVFDGHIGTIRTRLTDIPASKVTWASDGYIVNINERDPEYAFYDLDGVERDRTKGKSQYSFVPGETRGVTFTLDDHVRAGSVVGVNREGKISLWETQDRKDHSLAGTINPPGSNSIISVSGVSVSGSHFLFRAPNDSGYLIVDGKGETVFTWPMPVNELRIEAGYLIFTNRGSTVVLLP